MRSLVFMLSASALLACAHQTESRSTQAASAQPSQGSQSTAQPSQESHSSTSQGSQSSAQASQPSSSPGKQTIDCPPEALAKAEESLPSSSPVGTPGGTGVGSGAEAVPGQGAVKRVAGDLGQIDSSRTARGFEVSGVKLWVEPTTAILLECQQASFADLKEGTPVKATYEEKNGRNIAKVIEAHRR